MNQTPTRLSVLCERLVEAGWLAALIVTPLLFNLHSGNAFELDKAACLRAIAVVILLAWAVRSLEVWSSQDGRSIAGPLASWSRSPADRVERLLGTLRRRVSANPWPSLAMLAFTAEAMATTLSVAPYLSLWGSSERHQGLQTTGAYLVVFLALLRFMRTREQLERLVTTVLLTSVPVSLYGISQHFGIDPVPWVSTFSRSATSTMGNPIFVGAYLIMVVPLAIYRHVDAAREMAEGWSPSARTLWHWGSGVALVVQVAAWLDGPASGSVASLATLGAFCAAGWWRAVRPARALRLGVCSLLLSLPLACIVLTQSRGPWMGLAAGLFVFGLCWTVPEARWRRAAVAGACIAGVVVTLGLINAAAPHLPFVRDAPDLGRLARLVEGTGRVRLLIWEAVDRLVAANPLRAVAGHGPETMGLVTLQHLSPEVRQFDRRAGRADRAHNGMLDILVTTGAIGVVARLLLLGLLFAWGLRVVGLAPPGGGRRLPQRYWLGGAVAALVIARALDGSWRFTGVALVLGGAAGILVYLGTRARHRGPGRPGAASSRLLAAALLSALVAHVVESQVGIVVTATHTHFWAYLAALVAVPRACRRPAASLGRSATAAPVDAFAESPEIPRTFVPPQGASSPRVTSAWRHREVLASAVLASLGIVTFLHGFLSSGLARTALPPVLWMVAFTCLAGGLLGMTGDGSRSRAAPAIVVLRGWAAYAAVIVPSTLLATVILAPGGLRSLGVDGTSTPLPYYAIVVVALLATGAALLHGERLPSKAASVPAACGASVLSVAAFVMVLGSSVSVVEAEIAGYRAVLLSDRLPDHALALARRAAALQPGRDVFQRGLGQALALHARRASGSDADALWEEAEARLTAADELNRLEPGHAASLGQFHEVRAEYTDDSAVRQEHLARALHWYTEAAARSPNDVRLWNELGAARLRSRDLRGALEAYRHSLALDDRRVETHVHLGDLHRARGDVDAAVEAYLDGLRLDPNSADAHRALASVYAHAGRLADVIDAHERALAATPGTLAHHRALVSLYLEAREPLRAAAHAERATAVAPAPERPAVERLITALEEARGR